VKPLVSSILLLFVSSLAFSQTKVTEEIIVTASQLPETVESTPAAVSVVTRQDIERRADRDVTEALRELPGLTISRTGSFGKTASIFMRGASSKQTLVLWNGVEINDPYFSGYNWGQLSTVGIEKIEVVRGPFSSLYGADAVGGVINIITTGGQGHTTFDIAGGGRGLINAIGSAAETIGAATLNVAVEHRQDNGFAPNDNGRQNSMLGGLTFAPKDGFSVGLLGRYANYDLGVPRSANAFGTAFESTPHHRENGTEWQLAIPLRLDFQRLQADVRLSENHRDDNAVDPDSQSLLSTTSQRRTAHLSARSKTGIGTVIVGIEGERTSAESTSSFGLSLDSRRRSSNALFAEDRVAIAAPRAARFEIAVGLRRDHFDTFGSETSPRLAAAWIKSGHKLRAAFGEAFRAPYIGELYLPFFGNPNLQAERSRSFEIG
jgi:vitamin B12 transporter